MVNKYVHKSLALIGRSKCVMNKFKLETILPYWSMLLLIFLTYSAIEIPLALVFDYELKSLFFINIFVNLVFFLDLGISIMKAKESKKKDDFSKYMKSWFIIDLLSAIPFELLLEFDYLHDSLEFLKLLRIIRLIRIFKIFHISKQLNRNEFQGQAQRRILTLMYISSLGAHWIALMWTVLNEIPEGETQVSTYINSLYWTLTTLTTIGYGDITPKTDPQKLFTMVIMIVGAGMYGYIIGNIANLLANIDYAKTVFTEKMERINTFLKYRNLPASLQENIYQYYNYVWENKKGYDESEIMSELPASLRMKISLYLNAGIFEKIPLFAGASDSMIADFVIRLRPVIFTPKDYIIKKGERGDCLYFISSGKVEVVNDETGDNIATLGVGAYFGEIALVDSTPRSATIRAIDYCDLYSLDKVSFDEVIKDYPEFYQKIKEMARARVEENKKRELEKHK